MKLHFDANQQFQLGAVAAVTELVDGQTQGAPEFNFVNVSERGSTQPNFKGAMEP